jgi:quinol monooxygenase YgiN
MSTTPAHLTTIGRFLAKEGCEEALAEAIRKAWGPARDEPGCVSIFWYRATKNTRLFFVHSVWADEAAFDIHADLPHTEEFIETALTLIDHPLDVTRLRVLDSQ